jgi:hypothetical protein
VFGLLAVAACGGGGDETLPTTTSARPTTTAEPATTTTTEAPTTTTTAPPPAPTYPLTGLPADNPLLLARPALVVKIENADSSSQTARPQQGLNEADVVYEETVEGSITRFAAVFHSADSPNRVGPIRSFRDTDIALVSDLNHPLYAWSGAHAEWMPVARSMPVTDVGYDAVPGAYFRDTSRKVPHNLYSTMAALYAYASPADHPPPPLFTYRTADGGLAAGARPATTLDVVFGTGPGSAPVHWQWEPSVGLWTRYQRGTPHVDDNGIQIAPQNLIIQFIDYHDSGYVDSTGATIYTGSLVGSGEAWLLTAGTVAVGTWSKTSPEAITQFTDAEGRPFELTPGRTWVILPWRGVATVTVQ